MGVWTPERYFRVQSLTEGGRVAWILRLVKIGADGDNQSTDVMTINRPDDLGDIATLGLTLAEGKLLLAGLQQEIVAAQAKAHAVRRPDCRSCGLVCRVKDYRDHRVCHVVRSGHGAASSILLCWMRRTRSWPWLTVALPLDTGVGSDPGASLRLDDIPCGR